MGASSAQEELHPTASSSSDGDALNGRWIRNHCLNNGDDSIHCSADHSATAGGSEVLRVLFGIAIGVFIYTNPEARQITADALRAAGDALAPAVENKTLEDRINEVLVGD